VKPNNARTLSIQFHPSFDGEYEDVLELIFLDHSARNRFLITRKLCAVVGSEADYKQLKPKAAYIRRKPAPFQFDGPIIRTLRPPTWGPIEWISRLPEFKSPENLIRVAFGSHSGSYTKSILQAVNQFLPSSFTVNTYGKHFQVLLYIEDEQMRFVLFLTPQREMRIRTDGIWKCTP
jgi:helicase MOV-10